MRILYWSAREVLFSKNFKRYFYTPSSRISCDAPANQNVECPLGQTGTNGHNDGALHFTEVGHRRPCKRLSMDLNPINTHVFPRIPGWGEIFPIQVSIDGGNWVLLDNYQVNDQGTAIGSAPKRAVVWQQMATTVSYSGDLDPLKKARQFRRIVSGLSQQRIYSKGRITSSINPPAKDK